MKRRLLHLGILSLIITGCIETEPVSPVPEITYKSFELFYYYDSTLEQYLQAGELIFDFIDGDADLGIYPEYIDTTDSASWNEENYNIFLMPYEKIDTFFYAVEPDTSKPPPWYAIQHDTKLDRVGQNKTIKGTINLLILDVPEFDSMRYDFYIRDRAGNNSNVESTDVVHTIFEVPKI